MSPSRSSSVCVLQVAANCMYHTLTDLTASSVQSRMLGFAFRTPYPASYLHHEQGQRSRCKHATATWRCLQPLEGTTAIRCESTPDHFCLGDLERFRATESLVRFSRSPYVISTLPLSRVCVPLSRCRSARNVHSISYQCSVYGTTVFQ